MRLECLPPSNSLVKNTFTIFNAVLKEVSLLPKVSTFASSSFLARYATV